MTDSMRENDYSPVIKKTTDNQKIASKTFVAYGRECLHGSPQFYKMLEEMADTHDRKSHDYASNDNPYGNYHFAGELACLFKHSPEDAGFVGRLGEKIYRLANLEGSGKSPSNESIEDTERDIAVITVLWMASRRAKRLREKS